MQFEESNVSGNAITTIKVLHVAETIRGGIASYLNELHSQQRATLGLANVHYVVPSDHRGDLVDIDDANVTTFERHGRSVFGFFQMLRTTLQTIDVMQPDVVHLHSSFSGLVLRSALIARSGRPRIIYCPHGWAFLRETGRVSYHIAKAIEGALARVTDRIICISGDELRGAAHAGISADRLALVHNGISTRRSERSNGAADWISDKAKVLFIGRLDRQKGYDLLIEAASSLQDKIDVRIVGASVVSNFHGPAIPPNVSLLGWLNRQQIEGELESADLVVIPSRWEAFGLVALEAMRAAKPILAFRIGALPEIVDDGITGVLCEPVSADGLANGFRRMLQEDIKALGQRGRDRFQQRYDIAKTHRHLHQIYVDVVNDIQPTVERQIDLQSDASV